MVSASDSIQQFYKQRESNLCASPVKQTHGARDNNIHCRSLAVLIAVRTQE